MRNRERFDIHADDYGVSLHGAEDIIECLKEGALDSLSVIPNMSCFEACAEKYLQEKETFPKAPLLTVHLNIMDGKPLSAAEEVPDLTDAEGFFSLTWGKLFLMNYFGGSRKKRVSAQLKKEFRAQMKAVQETFGLRDIRLDSHQHPHMIPFVFDILMEICDEEAGHISFVRVAKEPLLPFLSQVPLYRTYPPANLVKNVLLNRYAVHAKRELKKRGMDHELMWGLVMSGFMDEKRTQKLLPYMERSAAKKKKKLEILFHPGRMLETERTEEYRKEGFFRFYCSENREEEKRAVKKMKRSI